MVSVKLSLRVCTPSSNTPRALPGSQFMELVVLSLRFPKTNSRDKFFKMPFWKGRSQSGLPKGSCRMFLHQPEPDRV